MRYLLDTNVISEPGRPRPSGAVLDWLGRVRPADTAVSVMTIGELRKGAEQLRARDVERAVALDEWIAETVTDFGDRVLAVDVAIAQAWGRLEAKTPRPRIHGLIAATALVHGLSVATRNTRDFERCGVPVVNPFEEDARPTT
jgi:predicted nucleic acid-binding protein